MAQRKESQVLIPSTKIKEAARGYQPMHGDATDIFIRDAMNRLEKKLRLVDNKELRRLESLNATGQMTPKMREILHDEKSIIFSMEQRKFNF